MLNDQERVKKQFILKLYEYLAIKNPYWRGRHLMQLIQSPEKTQNFFYQYSYSLLAPIYATFVLGVIEQIKEKRIQNVYFLAREGELFMKIFEKMAPYYLKKEIFPEIHYLYVSRKSTALAAVANGLSYELAVIPLYNAKQKGIASIFQVYGLPFETLTPIAQKFGFSNIEEPIYDFYDSRLLNLLTHIPFQKIVCKHAIKNKQLLKQYLTQHRFFEKKQVAFVDIGWNGTIQKFIQDTFVETPDFPHVHGLYMAYVDGLQYTFVPEKSSVMGILYDERDKEPTNDAFKYFEELFEESARATHATTIGYTEKQGIVHPIFQNDLSHSRRQEIIQNKQLQQSHQGILDSVDELIKAIKNTQYNFLDIKPFILTMVERSIVFPQKEEVNQLLAVSHSEDFGTDVLMDFAHDRIHFRQAIRNPWHFLKILRHSNWRYAVLSDVNIPASKTLLRLFDILRRF